MAGYRRYRRFSRYGRRYTGSRKWRRTRGQYRAANQQKDSGTFIINATTVANVSSNASTMINVYDILRKSEFFTNYANMYDQFKINRIRIKLTQGNATTDAFTLVSAWDRNGIDLSQLSYTPATASSPGSLAGTLDMPEQIRTYSSAVTKSVSSGSSFSMVRYLAPSTLAEKSQWISPSQLQPWYTAFQSTDTNRYQNYTIPTGTTVNTTNPSFIPTDTNLQFKPTFLMTLWSQSASQAIYNCEFDISVTFRGMRKSAIV